MGGYNAGPVMMAGGDEKLRRKPYAATPAFAFAPGYVDHRRMGGYYHTVYGGMVPPGMMRGHLPLDHSNMVASSVDYLSEHFQGEWSF